MQIQCKELKNRSLEGALIYAGSEGRGSGHNYKLYYIVQGEGGGDQKGPKNAGILNQMPPNF